MFEVPATHAKLSAARSGSTFGADGTQLGGRPTLLSAAEAAFTCGAGEREAARERGLPNDGGTVRIWSGRDKLGDDCFRYLRNGKSQRFPVWDYRRRSRTPAIRCTVSQRELQKGTPVQWMLLGANRPDRPDDFG